MDTRFIQTLLSVIDLGSFADAARFENLTLAAVAQRVRSLENDLGESLLLRVGQRVKPTQVCISLLPRLRHVISEVSQLTSDLDASGLKGQIRMGAISTALSDRVPGLLAKLTRQAPQATLSVTPGTSEELFQKLMKEELDAAFLILP